MQSKFNEYCDNIEKTGEEHAVIKGQSWQMQELCASVKAKIQKRLIDQGMAIGKSEVEAKASKEYEDYVIATSKMIEQEHRLRAKYEADKSRFEGLRSLCSLEKKTRSLIDQE